MSVQAAERPLDLHEGICDPGPAPRPVYVLLAALRAFRSADVRPATGCQRWPEHLALLNRESGQLHPGRCRATNLCRYCQTLYVVETVEMLTLDAMEYAPTLWLVLTAREHLTRKDTYAHLRQIRKAVRRRWPNSEWFVQIEFQRRGALHLNLLVKGVPATSAEALRDVVSGVWCARVDAEPVGQWAGAIEDGVGVVRYLAKMLAHGLKAEQRPPIGWRGHRTSQTRGYLVRPAAIMREEAKRSLRIKRALHRGESLEVAEHAEENRPEFELFRERGKQPGREASFGAAERYRAARARSRWVQAYAEYLRGSLVDEAASSGAGGGGAMPRDARASRTAQGAPLFAD